MRYQSHQSSEDKKQWLSLETTLGTNIETIGQDILSFTKLVASMDDLEKAEFTNITGYDAHQIASFQITDQKSLQLVLMRKFIGSISLPVINESLGIDGASEGQIYLRLTRRLIEKGIYPNDVFTYSTYRGRGTPTTWLSIDKKYTETEIKDAIDKHIRKILNKVNYRMPHTRRFIGVANINGLVIYLFSKANAAKVVRAEKKNVEVQGASYSLIILDLSEKKIGIVTGSKREIQLMQTYLMSKVFDEPMSPPRNDVSADGNKMLRDLLKPKEDDGLILQSLEMRTTTLKNGPSLKVKVRGNDNLDEALDTLVDFWGTSSIADMRQVEFAVPTGRVNDYRKIGLYGYGDEWRRLYFNSSTKRITNIIEKQFLERVSQRLGGNDIKSTRFVLEELDSRFIVDKLLRDKTVATNPAIPVEAEEIVVKLTSLKLISKQEPSVKRKCRHCYTQSWDQLACPSCGRDEMSIMSEGIRILPNESQIMKQLALNAGLLSFDTKYYPSKSRKNHRKSLVGIFDSDKNITVFVVMVSDKKDIEYIEYLSNEGFGVVAVVDPKIVSKTSEIERAGCTPISLTDIMLLLLGETTALDIVNAVTDQEKVMLGRIVSNAKSSVSRIMTKPGNYDETYFEVDVKNIMNLLVPDVVRLGMEFSGTSVPDGYLRYGTKGIRTPGRARRLFGWDAKYSKSGLYSLSASDVSKQKKYIAWLRSKKNQPSKFGQLGIYSVISNFSDYKKMNTALTKVAEYKNLPKSTRIVLIEDLLLSEIGNWLLDNWKQVLENNSLISDEVFAWLRRKPLTGMNYTVSRGSDWPKLKTRLDKIITNQ